MHHNDPLEASLAVVKGYNDTYPLKEEELAHLFVCIAMRLIVSVTKSAINKQKEPTNKYLLVSEEYAWQVLKKWFIISPDFAEYSFRNSCGFSAHPDENTLTIKSTFIIERSILYLPIESPFSKFITRNSSPRL